MRGSYSYEKALEALATIQKKNFDPDDSFRFNLCAALANLTGAIKSDLDGIRRDLAELKRGRNR